MNKVKEKTDLFKFNFVILTYNHEKYIIEHLESIKYQIKSFGKNMIFNLYVFDDCSIDRTISLVYKWISFNKYLFESYYVHEKTLNQGIVSNYLEAINKIDLSPFKILGGDDLYFKNNIFNLIQDKDLVFTSSIRFMNNTIIQDFNLNFLIMNKSIKKIRKWIKIGNIIDAPGAFLNPAILKNYDFQKFLLNFRNIEDLPQWNYIFNNEQKLDYNIDFTPYILYRQGNGVTYKYKRNKTISKEIFNMRKILKMKLYWLPLSINPYRIIKKLKTFKINLIDSKKNYSLIEYKENKMKGYNDFEDYIFYIKNKSDQFLKNIGGL